MFRCIGVVSNHGSLTVISAIIETVKTYRTLMIIISSTSESVGRYPIQYDFHKKSSGAMKPENISRVLRPR